MPLTIDKAARAMSTQHHHRAAACQLPAGKECRCAVELIGRHMLQVEGQWSAETSGTTFLTPGERLDGLRVRCARRAAVGSSPASATHLHHEKPRLDGRYGHCRVSGPGGHPSMGMPGPHARYELRRSLYAYSFAEKRWVPTATNRRAIGLEPAADLMSPDGRVYVASSVGRVSAVTIPELKAEVEAH